MLLLEIHTARVGCYMFGFGAGVFPAVKGTQGIDFAHGFALGIITKPRAHIGKLAAGAAAVTLAFAVFGNRQKGGKCPLELGNPGVFRGQFFFSFRHNLRYKLVFRRQFCNKKLEYTSKLTENCWVWHSRT